MNSFCNLRYESKGVLFLGGGVAQSVAHLTCDWWIPISCEFEPQLTPGLFP